MRENADDSTDQLNDAQLLEREWLQRDEFERLRLLEPPSLGTTYGQIRGSSALVKSFDRWWKTNLAARMRGIIDRVIGR
jgi:hypothetical protein